VGAGGVNSSADVLLVQKLLNGVAPSVGGPTPLLSEDSLDGPLTNAAIKAFQHRQGMKVADSRVDPHGPTLRRLNEVSVPGQREAAIALRSAARLKRVHDALPQVLRSAELGGRTLEAAMDHLTLGDQSLARDSNALAFRKADLYFSFGKQSQERTLDELKFIRTTFTRVSTVLKSKRSATGRNPFGEAIFAIDPLGKPWSAYSPTQASDARRNDGVTSGHIYLGDKIDPKVPDHFAHILLHELFHFVDEETAERRIVDAKGGYMDGAMKLPHARRMHNSDNYALLGTHVAIGRTRLIASQPKLAPFIPPDLT
jgi:hypothetical protein